MPKPLVATYSGACPVINGKLIIVGGFTTIDGTFSATSESDFTRLDLVTVYDVANSTFSYNTPLPEVFSEHLVLLAKDKIFVLGGKVGPIGELEETTSRMVVGAFAE